MEFASCRAHREVVVDDSTRRDARRCIVAADVMRNAGSKAI